MASGTYTDVTLGDAWAELGNRLFDPAHARWTTPELTLYVQQALRTFNALTNHFRAEGTFESATPEAFYDLPTVLPLLRAQSYTTLEAVQEICYHLLEPVPVGGAWAGTQQYSLNDILTALQQARDRFLLETGIVQTHSLLTVDPPPASGVVSLEENIINLRRLAWKTSNGIITILNRDDRWSLTNYARGWKDTSGRPPKVYSVSTQPPLKVQLAPLTTIGGVLDRVTINSGTAPDILDPTQSLGVPNDWAWVVVFGALTQLFQRDGLAIDVGRSQYCEQRWSHGLKMARAAGVVLAAQIDGEPVVIGSLQDADVYSPSWQMVTSTPRRLLTAGHTIVGLWPPPGVPVEGGNYEVLLQVVRNAPVPSAAADFLQVGPELFNPIMDYAQHLAIVKEGSGQIQSTNGLLQSFMEICGVTVDIQYSSQPAEMAAIGQTTQDQNKLSYQEPQ